MTLTLPAFLPPPLVTLVAGNFPEGLEDVMEGVLTAAHRDTEAVLRTAAELQTELAQQVMDSATGAAGAAAATSMLAAAKTLSDLAESEGQLADHMETGARDIEFEKLLVIFSLLILAAQLALAVAFPGGALVATARWVATRQTIRSAFLQLLAKLTLKGTALLEAFPWASVLVRGGGAGAFQGAGADLAAQHVQIDGDTRDEVDKKSVWVSTASGFAGGVAGDAAARWAEPAVRRLAVRATDGQWGQQAISVVLLGGIGGVAGAPAGLIASTWASGRSLSDLKMDDWREGVITGFGGGVIGAAGYAIRSPMSPMPPGAGDRDDAPRPAGPGPGLERMRAWASSELDRTVVPDRSETSVDPQPNKKGTVFAESPGVVRTENVPHIPTDSVSPTNSGPGNSVAAHPVRPADPVPPPQSENVASPAERTPAPDDVTTAPASSNTVPPPDSGADPGVGSKQQSSASTGDFDAPPEQSTRADPAANGAKPHPDRAVDDPPAAADSGIPTPEAIRQHTETGLADPDRPHRTSEESESGTATARPPETVHGTRPDQQQEATPSAVAPAPQDGPDAVVAPAAGPNQPSHTTPPAARVPRPRTPDAPTKPESGSENAPTPPRTETPAEPAASVFPPPDRTRPEPSAEPTSSAVTAPEHSPPPQASDGERAVPPADSDATPGQNADPLPDHDTAPPPTEGVEPASRPETAEPSTDRETVALDQFDPLESIQLQRDVEAALRDSDGGTLIGADPRKNPYRELINGGNPDRPGRDTNCVETSLCAVSSFHGVPLAAQRLHNDGTVKGRFGEARGTVRAALWAGQGYREIAPGEHAADKYQQLYDEVAALGPMSAALVGIGWAGTGSDTGILDGHMIVLVYPPGSDGPVFWDAQSGQTWDVLPEEWIDRTARVDAIVLSPEQGRARTALSAEPLAAQLADSPTAPPRSAATPVSEQVEAGDREAVAYTGMPPDAERPGNTPAMPGTTPDPSESRDFGHWLRAVTEARGLSPADLAKACGTHPNNVYRWLGNYAHPNHENQQRLRAALHIPDEVWETAAARYPLPDTGYSAPPARPPESAIDVDWSDAPPTRETDSEPLARIRDITADNAATVRIMMNQWLASWSSDPEYVAAIADTVAAAVSETTGTVEVVVRPQGSAEEGGGREITVIDRQPGQVNSRAETVWKLPLSPMTVEPVTPARLSGPAQARHSQTEPQHYRSRAEAQGNSFGTSLRKTHPWLTTDQIDSAAQMFTELYSNALTSSPNHAAQVSVAGVRSGELGQGVRVTVSHEITEGEAAQLSHWGGGREPDGTGGDPTAPTVHAHSDVNSRRIELRPGGRTVEHVFEIHKGSRRQAVDSGAPGPEVRPPSADPPVEYRGQPPEPGARRPDDGEESSRHAETSGHRVDEGVAEIPVVGPEGPLMLEGRQALEDLVARYGDRIVFHGSDIPIQKLEPRQMAWRKDGRTYLDGDPAICADAGFDVPMFMALYRGSGMPHGYSPSPAETGEMVYHAPDAGSSELTGYIHVMDRQSFQMTRPEVPDGWPVPYAEQRPLELRCSEEVAPFAIVEVTTADFPHTVHESPTGPATPPAPGSDSRSAGREPDTTTDAADSGPSEGAPQEGSNGSERAGRSDGMDGGGSGPNRTARSLDAELLGAPVDEWSNLGLTEVAQSLQAEMRRRGHSDFEVTGFDEASGINVEAARECARALIALTEAYPQVNLSRFGVSDLGNSVIGEARSARALWGSPHTHTGSEIILSASSFSSVINTIATFQISEENGWLFPRAVERPVSAIVAHEFAHALDNATGYQSQDVVVPALVQYYLNRGDSDATVEGFFDWLSSGLPGYAELQQNVTKHPSYPQGPYRLNIEEAVAEAFAEVWHRGDDAKDAAGVIAAVLTAQDGIYSRFPVLEIPGSAESSPPRVADGEASGRDAIGSAELLGVPEGADEWSGLTPDQVGEKLQADLREVLNNPEFEVFGFQRAGLDPDVVREIARGVADMAREFPRAGMRRIGFGEGFFDRVPSRSSTQYDHEADVEYVESLEFNAELSSHPQSLRDLTAELYPGFGESFASRRSGYATAVYGFVQALDNAHMGDVGRRYSEALTDHYLENGLGENSVIGLLGWLNGHFSGDSFDLIPSMPGRSPLEQMMVEGTLHARANSDAFEMFNATRGLAEAMVALGTGGNDAVSVPARLAHEVLRRSVGPSAEGTVDGSRQSGHRESLVSPEPNPVESVRGADGPMLPEHGVGVAPNDSPEVPERRAEITGLGDSAQENARIVRKAVRAQLEGWSGFEFVHSVAEWAAQEVRLASGEVGVVVTVSGPPNGAQSAQVVVTDTRADGSSVRTGWQLNQDSPHSQMKLRWQTRSGPGVPPDDPPVRYGRAPDRDDGAPDVRSDDAARADRVGGPRAPLGDGSAPVSDEVSGDAGGVERAVAPDASPEGENSSVDPGEPGDYAGPPQHPTLSGPAAEVVSFDSPESVRAYAEQNWGDGREHRALFDTYITEGAAINHYLRGNADWHKLTMKRWSGADVDGMVAQLHSAMKPLSDTVVVQRFIRAPHLSGLGRGDLVTESAFTSTTPDPEGPFAFAHRSGVVHLTVPPGIPVAFLRNGADNELLLPTGLQWRVTDTVETDGKTHVHGVVERVTPEVLDDHSRTVADRDSSPAGPSADPVPPVDYAGPPPDPTPSDSAAGKGASSDPSDSLRADAELQAEGNDNAGPDGSRDGEAGSAWSADAGDLIDRYVGSVPPSYTELRERMHALAERHPGSTTLDIVGFSDGNVPIEVLSINGSSTDSENIVFIVDPHPMEQIGRASALAMAEHVAANPELRSDASYHFVVSFDPDSAILNSRWPAMEGPVDIVHNHVNFHRDDGAYQPEWRFGRGADGSVMRESRAIMEFVGSLDRAPSLMFSLHNAAGGGAYALVASEGGRHTDIEGVLADRMSNLGEKYDISIEKYPAGTALHASLGPGVSRYPAINSPNAGSYGSVHYIAERGGIAMIIELPQWDTEPMNRSREEYAELTAERIEVLDRVLDRLPRDELQKSLFGRAAVFMKGAVDQKYDTLTTQTEGPIYGASHFHWSPLRSSGMLLRAIGELRTKYPDNQEYVTAFTELGEALQRWSREAEDELQPKWNSLHSTGGFQLGFMMEAVQEQLLRGDAPARKDETNYTAEIAGLDGTPQQNAAAVRNALHVQLESLSSASSVEAVAERVSEVVGAASGEVQVRVTLPLPVAEPPVGTPSVQIEVVDSWADGAASSVRTRWELTPNSRVMERAVPEQRSQRSSDELDSERAAAIESAGEREVTRHSSEVRQLVRQRLDPRPAESGESAPDELQLDAAGVVLSDPGAAFSWLTPDHLDSIGVMFGELHANAAIHAPDNTARVRIESGEVEGQRWVQVAVTNSLAEGQAAQLKPWSGEQQELERTGGRGTSMVHKLSDANGRDLWLGAEDRSVTHWFEVREGSSRYEGKDDDAGTEPEGDGGGPESVTDADLDALLDQFGGDEFGDLLDVDPGGDPVDPGSSADQSRRVPVEEGTSDPVVPPVDYAGPPPDPTPSDSADGEGASSDPSGSLGADAEQYRGDGGEHGVPAEASSASAPPTARSTPWGGVRTAGEARSAEESAQARSAEEASDGSGISESPRYGGVPLAAGDAEVVSADSSPPEPVTQEGGSAAEGGVGSTGGELRGQGADDTSGSAHVDHDSGAGTASVLERWRLSPEQLRAAEAGVEELRAVVRAETDRIGEFRRAVGGAFRDGRVSLSGLGLTDAVDSVLDSWIDSYVETPEGRRDSRYAELRELASRDDPDTGTIRRLSEMLGIDRPPLSSFLPGGEARYVKRLHAAAADELAELSARAPERTPGADHIARDLGTYATESTGRAWRSVTERSGVDEITAGIMRVRDELSRLPDREWDRNKRDLLCSELITGAATRNDLHRRVTAAVGRLEMPRRISDVLDASKQRVVDAYAESSIRGALFREQGDDEGDAYSAALSQIAQQTGSRVPGADLRVAVADWMKDIPDIDALADAAQTLYYHFTPNIAAIAQSGALKSGGSDDVVNLTADHSVGVHFVKPGSWQGDESYGLYFDYAAAVESFDTRTPVRNAMGAIVVFPLGSIVEQTPVRSEVKTTSPKGEHQASDATFRPADRSDTFSYSLDKAYLIPCYSSEQVALEKRAVIDPDTGALEYKPYSYPLEEVLREHGYDEAWIAERVINVPDGLATRTRYELDPDTKAKMLAAQNEIRDRMTQSGRFPDEVVLPAEVNHAQHIEGLDKHGTPWGGAWFSPSKNVVEHLTTTLPSETAGAASSSERSSTGSSVNPSPWSGEQQGVDRNGGRGTPIVHSLSDGNGRDLWLGAEDRSVTHWFEVHEGSRRYSGLGEDAEGPAGEDAGPEVSTDEAIDDYLARFGGDGFGALSDGGLGDDSSGSGSSVDSGSEESGRVAVEGDTVGPSVDSVPPVDFAGPPPELPGSDPAEGEGGSPDPSDSLRADAEQHRSDDGEHGAPAEGSSGRPVRDEANSESDAPPDAPPDLYGMPPRRDGSVRPDPPLAQQGAKSAQADRLSDPVRGTGPTPGRSAEVSGAGPRIEGRFDRRPDPGSTDPETRPVGHGHVHTPRYGSRPTPWNSPDGDSDTGGEGPAGASPSTPRYGDVGQRATSGESGTPPDLHIPTGGSVGVHTRGSALETHVHAHDDALEHGLGDVPEDGRHPGSNHGTAARDTPRESPGYIARSGRDTDDGSAPGVRETGVAPNRNTSQNSVIRETLRSYRRSVPDDGRVIAVDARGRAPDDRKLPAYEVRRFGGVDSAVMVLEVRVYGTVDAILSRRGAQNVVEHVQRVIDNSLNLPGGVLPTGDRLLVDVVPTNDPDNAHLRIQAGQRGAGPGVWSDRDGPDIVVDRLRRQLGLHPVGVGGTSAPSFSPDDLRTIADDIAAARPTDTNSLSATRVIGPGKLGLLEKDSHRTRVEDALRAGDGYLRWADPSKNGYGSLINDGGPGEFGRFNNCVDCVLAALDSFYGRPQVAHPRWSDPTSERSKGGLLAGEFRGGARIAGALGKEWRDLGESKLSVSGQLNTLQREVADMKQGAVAVVVNYWQARDPQTGRALFTADDNPKVDGSHVTLCVYPKGESGPVWWDPQSGATSREVPPELAMESASIHRIILPPNADVLGGEKAAALAERAERPTTDGEEDHPAKGGVGPRPPARNDGDGNEATTVSDSATTSSGAVVGRVSEATDSRLPDPLYSHEVQADTPDIQSAEVPPGADATLTSVAIEKARSDLANPNIGNWALHVLDSHGVEIRLLPAPDHRTAAYPLKQGFGYDPAVGILYWSSVDGTNSRAGRVDSMIHAASMIAQADSAGLLDPMMVNRAEYAELMTARTAEAYALVCKYNRAVATAPGADRVDSLGDVYDAAYSAAIVDADAVFRAPGLPIGAIEAAAYRAGVRAVGRALDTVGMLHPGPTATEFYLAQWDRAHGFAAEPPPDGLPTASARVTPLNPAERWALAGRYVEEIEGWQASSSMDHVVGAAERAYTRAYEKVRFGRRTPWSPPPTEEAARLAGRQAVDRYLRRVGPEAAELAFDVVRANHGGSELHWGRLWRLESDAGDGPSVAEVPAHGSAVEEHPHSPSSDPDSRGAHQRTDADAQEPASAPARPSRLPDLSSVPPLGELLHVRPESADDAALTSALQGLEQQYGPYRLTDVSAVYMPPVEVGIISSSGIYMAGVIVDKSGIEVGRVSRKFEVDEEQKIVVYHDSLKLEKPARRQGFAGAFLAATENYYRRSGVDRIHLIAADDDGGVVWARAGYDWDPDHFDNNTVEDLRILIAEAREESTPDDQRLLDDMLDRLEGPPEEVPSPRELVMLSGDNPKLGELVMKGSAWHGMRKL